MWSSASSSKSTSSTGMGGGVGSSTPRVARYSALTERRRWPLGSMCLDGMGGQLSGLERDNAGGDHHAEGDPLDGVEHGAKQDGVGVGLAQEGEEELGHACSVERHGMQAGGGIRWDGETPGERGGEAGVAAFGEVAQGQKRPGEGGAWSPGVQGT